MQNMKELMQKNQSAIFSGNPAEADSTSASVKTNTGPNQEKPTSSQPPVTEHIEKRIERLFLRLSAIYGYLWWHMYNNQELLTATKLEWSTSLKRFDNEILKEALLSYREKKGYPPALPEFMECCHAIQKRFEPCSVRPETFQRGDLTIAESNLQAMYAMLKTKS